jgi:large subunit ribosomal protein L29
MKTSDIRALSDKEIEERIAEDQKDLTDLRFRRAVAGLENPIVLREKRREIARLKTVLNEKRDPLSSTESTATPASDAE